MYFLIGFQLYNQDRLHGTMSS